MKNLSFNKGRPYYLCVFIFVILLSNQIYAFNIKIGSYAKQKQHQITGTVTDAAGPIPSATVIVKGTTNSAVTDEKGNFSITANSTDVLVFSFIGYATQEITVADQTSIKVILSEDSTLLKEVTINAGYYKVKEKERTGSIAKISSQDIEKQPVSSPIAAMQGRMSGVSISQTTGTPGGGFNIQIRGLNSLRSQGNDPLYIIDGIPYASQSLGSSTLTNGVMPSLPSPLNSINPHDIESIEVLKDADATAIYGSRGANGVVLISTKKGKAGATKFSVLSANTVGSAVSNLKLLNTQQYLSMRREAFANDGITQYPSDAYDVNGIWSQSRDTDWKKELIGGTSFVQNLQVSASGGSKSTQFLVSGTYRNESTVTVDDGLYKKGILHSSITHKTADDKFSISFSSDYASDKNTLPGIDLSRFAYTLAPNAPSLYESNGTLNWENGTFDNPLANIEGVYLAQTHNLISNVMLSYKLLKSFEIKASAGFSDTNFTEYRTLPSTMYNPAWHATSNDSQVFNNTAARRSWIFEPQLNWIGKMGPSEVNILLGTTFQSQKEKLQSVYAMGFPSDALIHSLTAANMVMFLNDETSQYKYNAFFGRVNVDFYKKYILNITGRRDGSSRFGSEHRFANFGAFGAAWVFSKESFLEDNSEVVSFGKLRVSYGITGNDQIGDYQYLDTYSVTPNIYDGVVGLQPTQLFNPDFGWETNKKLETALELGFLKDRIYLSTAYFQNRSSNQLVGVPLPGTTGFPSVQANLNATVQNTGLEVELRAVAFEKNDFKWTSSFNYTTTKNKLLEYPGLDGSVYANTFVIGESISIQKLYHYRGIKSDTGTYDFSDVNQDGQLTIDDRQTVFNSAPKFYGGLSNNLNYKNWNLDFLFQFVKQKGLSEKVYYPTVGIFSNQPVAVLNHFPESNNPDTTQLYTSGNNAAVFTAQDYYTQSDAMIVDASYIRLKSLSVSYKIPVSQIKISSAKVWLQGQNLLTITNYEGVDPETRSIYYLPPLRQLTLGLQITF